MSIATDLFFVSDLNYCLISIWSNCSYYSTDFTAITGESSAPSTLIIAIRSPMGSGIGVAGCLPFVPVKTRCHQCLDCYHTSISSRPLTLTRTSGLSPRQIGALLRTDHTYREHLSEFQRDLDLLLGRSHSPTRHVLGIVVVFRSRFAWKHYIVTIQPPKETLVGYNMSHISSFELVGTGFSNPASTQRAGLTYNPHF